MFVGRKQELSELNNRYNSIKKNLVLFMVEEE